MSQKAVKILVRAAPNEHVWYARFIGHVLTVARRGGYFHYAELQRTSKRTMNRQIPADSDDIIVLK